MTTTQTSLGRVGIVGVGNISGQYFNSFKQFDTVGVTAVADLNLDRAKEAAEKNDVAKALTPEDLYNDPDVDIVLNLTIPQAHHEVAMAAVNAGKHVYNEKPLTETTAQGKELLAAAAANNVRVGCAPDTVMGSTWQKARQMIDEGAIGDIVGGSIHMLCPGHESWHPSPEFYYLRGGGPVMDMAPYFLHALFMLVGGVSRVTSVGRASFDTRTITSEPKNGTVIPVEVETHSTSILELPAGPFITMQMSFDVPGTKGPDIEIFGSEGVLSIHTPNSFTPNPKRGEAVHLKQKGVREWEEIEITGGPVVNGRGLGIADMAQAIAENRPHRASGELALHALEVMEKIEQASKERCTIDIESTIERPEPLPDSWNV